MSQILRRQIEEVVDEYFCSNKVQEHITKAQNFRKIPIPKILLEIEGHKNKLVQL
jgi:hypothetical protein